MICKYREPIDIYPTYFEDKISLFTGDAVQILSALNDNVINCFILSPPYDVLKKDGKIAPYATRSYEGYEWDFQTLARQMWRTLAPNGVIIWNIADRIRNGSETCTPERMKLFFVDELGASVNTIIIYQDGVGAKGSNNFYWKSFEYVYVFSKGKIGIFNPLIDRKNKYSGRKTTSQRPQKDGVIRNTKARTIGNYSKRLNVWTITPGHDEYNDHPAPMSEQLAKDLLYTFANENSVICDPMLGGGTSLTAALQVFGSSIDFVGIDLSKKYLKSAWVRATLTLEENYKHKMTDSVRDHFLTPIIGNDESELFTGER